MRRKVAMALAATTLLAAGCATTKTSSGDAGGSATSSKAASVDAVTCSNPEGGSCVNQLTPGRAYQTSQFEPRIDYSVTRAGWSNLEDLPGNFLLLPPGNDLEGVNAATSDFIGVYSSITASRFSRLDGCVTTPVASVPRSPAGFVSWLRRQPILRVSAPQPVRLSGLSGLRTDIRVTPGRTPTTCTEGATPVTVALLFSGVRPSSLDHGVVTGMTMRLYLLHRGADLMVVEVDDIDAAPGDLESLSAQVRRLRFAAS